MKTYCAAYPTEQHQRSAEKITEFFSAQKNIEAVLLICSCARGKATPDSCLDIAVLVRPETLAEEGDRLCELWEQFYVSERVFELQRKVGKYSQVDLDFTDGRFNPDLHGWTSGADPFELEIGNYLVYSKPLWAGGTYYAELVDRWLPYYGEEMRQKRLDMVRKYCLNNLHHIPLFVQRGQYFQSFQRLWHAFGEFLQALFISRRTYPISYDKWIHEQVAEILELPELYEQLPRLFEIEHFESQELAEKAAKLEGLLEEYVK